MTVNISIDAEIDRVRLTQQNTHPSAPASGYVQAYVISGSPHGGLFIKDSAGREIGPFITGTASSGSGDFVLISEQTPSGGTISFTSIPGTYKSLMIELTGRSDKAASNVEDMNLEFNGDATAGNYRYSYSQVYGAAATTATVGNDRIMARISAASSPANAPGSYRFDIPYYAGTTFNKIIFGQGAMRYDDSATFQLALHHWMEWENNAAITQIDLKLPSGNWVAGSKASLYGLK